MNIEEGDAAIREGIRENLKEPYRTLLGHFRHEVGHYYWDRLIQDTEWIDEFRRLFGDERCRLWGVAHEELQGWPSLQTGSSVS
jgi:hypothetical protein